MKNIYVSVLLLCLAPIFIARPALKFTCSNTNTTRYLNFDPRKVTTYDNFQDIYDDIVQKGRGRLVGKLIVNPLPAQDQDAWKQLTTCYFNYLNASITADEEWEEMSPDWNQALYFANLHSINDNIFAALHDLEKKPTDGTQRNVIEASLTKLKDMIHDLEKLLVKKWGSYGPDKLPNIAKVNTEEGKLLVINYALAVALSMIAGDIQREVNKK